MLLVLLFLFADPQAATSLLQRGLIALQHGQLVQARADLEQASKADVNNPYIWSSLAEVYLRSGERAKSADSAARAEKTGRDNPLVAHALAMYFSEAGQPDRAATFEEHYAQSAKADSDALARAAGLYLNADALDKADALARQALEQHPSSLAQLIMGRILLAEGHETEALAPLKKAWDAKPNDQEITFEYANALLRQQAFGQAADVVTQALQQHGGDPQLTLLLGVARYGQRRFEDAITAFLHVAENDPEIEQPYLFLGRLLEQAGPHLHEIIKADRGWVARASTNGRAALELAKALLQAEPARPEAESLLRRSIALDPKDWEAHFELGVWLEGKRRWAEAAGELKSSIALDPKQAMPHYHLARVYDRLGDSTQAEQERKLHEQLTAAAPAGEPKPQVNQD